MSVKIAADLAAKVKERASERCEYCHAPQAIIGQAFHFDHIVPLSLGGQTNFDNLAYACAHCNLAKSSKSKALDPITQHRELLLNPRKDKWNDHFCWSRDFRRLTGKTPKGRATVTALNMNDELLTYARHFWHQLDLIP